MIATNIAAQRLYNEQLIDTRLNTPGEVVGWLGAVQAQEYAHAKWALAQRLVGVTDADVEQAFADGAILRTHVMRPTWHFVTATDIRWILQLTAPRVNIVNGHMYRKLELDEALLVRSNDAIAKALEGDKQLTRAELASILEQIGINTEDGMRLGYIVHRAELDAVVCSGARRGKQFTYALLDERAPQAKILTRDEALAELTLRYFTSHGPAMIKDFAWWSGLTVADVKTGLEMVKPHIVQEVIDGKSYWYSSSMPAIAEAPLVAHLLPVYDEYTIAYKDHSAISDPTFTKEMINAVFTSVIAVRGHIVGLWKRTLTKEAAIVETRFLKSLTAEENDAFKAAIQRYSEFLGLSVVLS
jgi:hypothetical protein